jgi:hypothetical protein
VSRHVVMLNRQENIDYPHGGFVRSGFSQYLNTRFGLPFVKFINEVAGVIAKTVSAASLKGVARNWRNTNLPTIRQAGREQEVFHA